jgi:hypothetical protein
MDGTQETKVGMTGFVDDNNCKKMNYAQEQHTTLNCGTTFFGQVEGHSSIPNARTNI